MTFFEVLSFLLFKRISTSDNLNESTIQQFTPYMVSRWLSFYDAKQCIFVNETLNKFSAIDENKLAIFKLFYEMIPKLRYKRINYIKKTKSSDESDKENIIHRIAKSHHISTREVKMYMDL